jgi:hypothetical protein
LAREWGRRSIEFAIAERHKHIRRFGFIAGRGPPVRPQEPGEPARRRAHLQPAAWGA